MAARRTDGCSGGGGGGDEETERGGRWLGTQVVRPLSGVPEAGARR